MEPSRSFPCASCGAPQPAGDDTCAKCGSSVPTVRHLETFSGSAATPLAPRLEDAASRPQVQEELSARFEMVRELGAGGMGEVWLARDRRLGREVALKMVKYSSPAWLEDFEREGRLLALLEHERVVRLYDSGVAAGTPYLVMEYVRGSTLADRLMRGRPGLMEAVRIACDVLEGVVAAHRAGIVHRDLKPANVFLTESGRAKVADFGLALKPSTGQQDLAGTPGYLAPELLNGAAPSFGSDVYAAGVILIELLSGQRPARHRDSQQVKAADAELYARLGPTVPRALAELTRRAMAPDPAERATAGELIGGLTSWLERAGRRGRSHTAFPDRPYRFLSPLTAEDAPLYTGRESEVAELAEVMTRRGVRVVFVFGPCGIGKSSLLKAGLAPALDPERFEVTALTSGPDPARALVRALATDAEATNPAAVLALAARVRKRARKTLVLVVDQLEEVFTQNPAPAERVTNFFAVVEALVEAQALDVKIVLGFRTEFRGEMYPLERRLADHQATISLSEIGPAALAAAIEAPAHVPQYGFGYEKGLPARLAADILEATRKRGGTALPVMQIVCHQLLNASRARQLPLITEELYASVLGGAEGALSRFVEDLLAGERYGPRAPLARRLLAALTVKAEGGGRFARARDEEEAVSLPDREAARAVLEALIADHLVVRTVGEDGRRRVRLASEVVCQLVDGWELEPGEAERAARLLARAYRAWDENGRQDEDLLSGGPLRFVLKNRGAIGGLPPHEEAFLDRALAAARRRRQGLFALTGAATAVLLALVWTAFFRPGRLHVESSPAGAVVTCDGRTVGTTPLTFQTAPGVHELALTRAGHGEARLTVRTPSGGEATYQAVLPYPRGVLSVTSSPMGARCEVRRPDGVVQATLRTPFTTEVAQGRYQLALALEGHAPVLTAAFDVLPERQLTVHQLALESISGTLMIRNPMAKTGATVRRADGSVAARVALPISEPLRLPEGPYTVRAGGPSHRAVEQTVHVRRGQSSALTFWTPPMIVQATANADGPVWGIPQVGRTGRDGPLDVVTVSEAGYLAVSRGVRGGRRWVADLNLPAGPPPKGIWEYLRFMQRGLRAFAAKSEAAGWPEGQGPRPATWLTADARGLAPALGDVDGDALADVVIGWVDGTVRAYQSPRGLALWSRQLDFAIVSPTVLDDLTGDGVPDALVGGAGGFLTALDGKDGRTLWQVKLAGDVRSAPVVADLDSDGTPEVFVGTRQGHAVLASGRDGHVVWDRAFPGALEASPACADFDGDALRDLAIATTEGQVAVLSAKSGTPVWQVALGAGVDVALDAGDLDGDHRADLLASDRAGTVHALSGLTGAKIWSTVPAGPAPEPRMLGGAHVRLTPRVLNGSNTEDGFFFGGEDAARDGMRNVPGGSRHVAASLGDLDRDGTMEVLVSTLEGAVKVLEGKSGRTLWSAPLPDQCWAPPVCADTDEDGTPDVVVASTKTCFVMRARSRALWALETGTRINGHPVFGDLDGDGFPEVLLTDHESNVYARDAFTGRELWTRKVEGNVLQALELLDLDGDGRLEVVAGTLAGRLIALRGKDGAPLWKVSTRSSGAPDITPASIDADNLPDLIIDTDAGDVRAIRGRDGSTLWSFETDGGINSAGAKGDFDRDGTVDVAVGTTRGTVFALSGRTGRKLWQKSISGQIPHNLAITDANGDRVDDVVAAAPGTGLWVLSGADGSVLWRHPLDSNPMGALIALDVNGDGTRDVILGTSSGRVLARNGRDGKALWSVAIPAQPVGKLVVADVDADGVGDIWVNPVGGSALALSGRDGRLLDRFTPSSTNPLPLLVPLEGNWGTRTAYTDDAPRDPTPLGHGRVIAGFLHRDRAFAMVPYPYPVAVPVPQRMRSATARAATAHTAERGLRNAVLLSHGTNVSRLKLADFLDRAGRTDEAEAELRRALQNDPRDPWALHALGRMLNRNGRLDESREALKATVAVNPAHPDAPQDLAAVLVRTGGVNEVEAVYRNALAVKPDPVVHGQLAQWYANRNNLAGAEAQARAAIRLDPNKASYHSLLAEVLERQGRIPEAVAERQAARSCPADN